MKLDSRKSSLCHTAIKKEKFQSKTQKLLTMWLLLLVMLGLVLLYRWYRQSLTLGNLTDKYVFITGCDSGFGNLLAKQLDKRGMKVLATCLTETGAENLKKETSSRLQTRILDVTDSISVNSAAEWASTTVGVAGLWGLVNDAGVAFAFGPSEWQTKENFFKNLNVNLLGMVDVTVHLLHLVRKAQGRIVNVSSSLARLAVAGGGYCPSKFAVEGFSDTLRRDMRDFGVKVSIIEPGCFKTPMVLRELHVNNLTQMWDKLPEPVKESYGEDYFQSYLKGLETLTQTCSTKLHEVTDCMEHALTAVHPWTRYSPGWDSKLFYVPVSYLPTAISDYILCRKSSN